MVDPRRRRGKSAPELSLAADSRRKNSSQPQRNGERVAVVLIDSFGGRGNDEGSSAMEKHGGVAWSSVSRCLRSGRAKLGWGVSAVRHGEGLGAFYRASNGVEQAEGRTTSGSSVELQWRSRFEWVRKWGGVTGSWGDERGSGTNSFFPREGRRCCAGKVSRWRQCSARRRQIGLQPEEGERQLDLGWAERRRRPIGQMGRCEGFRPGEERGCGGLR
jgi:hypothetical protein